jgi:hypothetical protein
MQRMTGIRPSRLMLHFAAKAALDTAQTLGPEPSDRLSAPTSEKGCEVADIVSILRKITEIPDLFDKNSDPDERAAALLTERDRIQDRLKLNERKRNERRLRELMRAYRGKS